MSSQKRANWEDVALAVKGDMERKWNERNVLVLLRTSEVCCGGLMQLFDLFTWTQWNSLSYGRWFQYENTPFSKNVFQNTMSVFKHKNMENAIYWIHVVFIWLLYIDIFRLVTVTPL